jgi:hypothetical protein
MRKQTKQVNTDRHRQKQILSAKARPMCTSSDPPPPSWPSLSISSSVRPSYAPCIRSVSSCSPSSCVRADLARCTSASASSPIRNGRPPGGVHVLSRAVAVRCTRFLFLLFCSAVRISGAIGGRLIGCNASRYYAAAGCRRKLWVGLNGEPVEAHRAASRALVPAISIPETDAPGGVHWRRNTTQYVA